MSYSYPLELACQGGGLLTAYAILLTVSIRPYSYVLLLVAGRLVGCVDGSSVDGLLMLGSLVHYHQV